MASPSPNQARAVDPFASYNSDTVNKFTRMLTYGENGIATPASCDVTLDSTSITQVIVKEGFVYMDDVWLNISSPHIVDFEDPDHYYDFGLGFDRAGEYYIVLEYTFQKSRPAPHAEIKIVKPNQRSAYIPGRSWLFLKSVTVEGVGPFYITGVSDADPENLQNKRQYIRSYAGGEVFIPTHSRERDQGRITYGVDDDNFFFGLSDKWVALGSGDTFEINTTGFNLGELVYVNQFGNLIKAVSTLPMSTADGVVKKIGTTDGLVQMNGKINDVKGEVGESINIGDLVYLSKVDPGTVTTQKPAPISQFTGRCVGVEDSTSYTILFHRGEPTGLSGTNLAYTIPQISLPSGGAWISSGSSYYQEIDISDFDEKGVVFTIWDSTSGMVIYPENIEFVSNNIVRIWMPFNTIALEVLIIGSPSSTITSSNLISITNTLSSGGAWLSSGSLYYQDIDVSNIEDLGCSVTVTDTTSNEQITPSGIQFDSTSILRIWMPVNTLELEVTAIGKTSTTQSTSSLVTILPSGGSWILDSGLYYQDINTSIFNNNEITFQFYDIDTDEIVIPSVVFSVGNMRIWMPDNTHQLNATLIG